MKTQLTRRNFLKNTSIASGLLLLPSGVFAGAEETKPKKSPVNVASVGYGGIGRSDVRNVAAAGANIVALCDVDFNHLTAAAKQYPNAKTFSDYREMFEKMDKEIDAVIISTPDHSHFTIAMTAVLMGKHVYVQKPMCHTVDQVRRLTAAANEKGVVTQMGNQGHSEAHIRVVKEWYEAGFFGEIKEILCWTDRPIWPQGMTKFQPPATAPANLNWDLWLASATERPYSPGIAHFDWRAYYEYGCGAIGDHAVHALDPAHYILDLDMPAKIEVEYVSDKSPIAFPNSSKLVFHFPGNAKRGPVKIVWQDGKGSRPAPMEGLGRFIPKDKAKPDSKEGAWEFENNGTIFYGSKANFLMGAWANFFQVQGEEKYAKMRENAPPVKYPRIKGSHYRNWIEAIEKGGKACSNFDYAGPFTQMTLLGAIAQRLGRTLEWDNKAGKFINDPEADTLLVASPSRKGFLA